MRLAWIALVLACVVACNGPEPRICADPAASEAAFQALELVPEPNTIKVPEWKAERLKAFVRERQFSGWCHDYYPTQDHRRLTGPFIGKRTPPAQAANAAPAVYNGLTTHAQATVYYSEAMVRWLRGGRRGAIPDGAVMVKEMFALPSKPELVGTPDGWAVMIRDAAASRDGWLWFLYYRDGNQGYGFEFETLQYGLSFCLACHASTDLDAGTFAHLGNLTGDDVVSFVRIGSLVDDTPGGSPHGRFGNQYELLEKILYQQLIKPRATPNDAILSAYGVDAVAPEKRALPLDGFFDHVVAPTGATGRLLTADQCAGCHDTSDLVNRTYPEMSVPTPAPIASRSPVADLAPYGEWKGSLMSISARDPVFRAQLEYELIGQSPARQREISRTCLGCHAPMAVRTLPELADDPANLDACPSEPPDPAHPDETGFSVQASVSHCETPAATGWERITFGSLGRDGVSCMICHTMKPDGLGTPASFSGQFRLGDPNRVTGPYEDVKTLPMDHALGITPVAAEQISHSGLCGSCHMLEVGVYDDGPDPIRHEWEQTTYWEWERSKYPGEGTTCQSCHMRDTNPFSGAATEGRIANVEDTQFPHAPNRAPAEALDAATRVGYRRHTLHGINVFTMGMFQQFPLVLGSSTVFPNRAGNVLPPKVLSLAEAFRMAHRETATVAVSPIVRAHDTLDFTVTVTNLAGHNLPTGVQFRRAFLTVELLDPDGERLWCSGCTDAAGLIVDADGQPLASELTRNPDQLQPDFAVIELPDEVQIYESRHADCGGELTTSFLRLCRAIKENRLLPLGYTPAPESRAALEQIGVAQPSPPGTDEVRYMIALDDASKVSEIRVSLNYQPLPPFYLADRFAVLAEGTDLPAARRLLAFVSYLALDNSFLPIAQWKLQIACTAIAADGATSDCVKHSSVESFLSAN